MVMNGWEKDAECAKTTRQDELNAFFSTHRGDQAHALGFCRVCIVREKCLEDALEADNIGQYGIRGGLTEEQRRALKRSGNLQKRKIA